jgi:hypothetical protein
MNSPPLPAVFEPLGIDLDLWIDQPLDLFEQCAI